MIEEGELRFCSEKCHEVGRFRQENPMPKALVTGVAEQWFQGACPKCEGSGPVDVHFAHSVLSAVFVRFSRKQSMLSCRRCARKKQTLSLLATLLLGWWSLSGIIMTPLYIVRNLRGLFAPEATTPSPKLLDMAYWEVVRSGVEPVIYVPVDETGPVEAYS
jgi:hypothetical protein